MCGALTKLGSDYCGKELPALPRKTSSKSSKPHRATLSRIDYGAMTHGACARAPGLLNSRPPPDANPTKAVGLIVDLNARESHTRSHPVTPVVPISHATDYQRPICRDRHARSGVARAAWAGVFGRHFRAPGHFLSYLEQLFAKLRRSSLVSSVRGPGGGYQLSRGMETIQVAQVIDAVNESVDATRCQGLGTVTPVTPV